MMVKYTRGILQLFKANEESSITVGSNGWSRRSLILLMIASVMYFLHASQLMTSPEL